MRKEKRKLGGTCRMRMRAASVGMPRAISRSKRPARLSAGSSASGLLVAPACAHAQEAGFCLDCISISCGITLAVCVTHLQRADGVPKLCCVCKAPRGSCQEPGGSSGGSRV